MSTQLDVISTLSLYLFWMSFVEAPSVTPLFTPVLGIGNSLPMLLNLSGVPSRNVA